MEEYHFCFDSDYGAMFGTIEAKNEREEKECGEIVDFSRRSGPLSHTPTLTEPPKPFRAQVSSSRKRARASWTFIPRRVAAGFGMRSDLARQGARWV